MENRKVIVHITLGLGGGVGSVIKNLINYQIDRGYDVRIVYLENSCIENKFLSDTFKLKKYPICRKAFPGINLLFGLPVLKIYKEIYKENRNQEIIFHVHNLAPIGVFNDIKSIPLICTLHGINPNGGITSKVLSSFIMKKLVKENKQIIGVSSDTATYYNKKIKADYINVVRNGLDLICKNKVTKVKKKFTIGYVGYIDELKGWRILVRAIKELDLKMEMELVIAGTGPRSEVENLKSQIKEVENIVYLGEVEDASINIIPKFDVLVLLSKSEGIPMSIIEAFANKIPVITTGVGGIPEIVKDNINGYIVERKCEDVKKALKEILKEKAIYSDLSKGAYKTYTENFTMKTMGDKYNEIYSTKFRK